MDAIDPSLVILTPDQRVRVFISSTLEELADERTAARRAISLLHLLPVWFESGARPHPPRTMYRSYLEQSDVFVGIYWQSYGWVAPDMEISGLEDEYRLAGGKPALLYLKRPAPEQDPRLTALIDGIRTDGNVAYRGFTTPQELEQLLADDLAVLLSERFLTEPRAPEGAQVPSNGSSPVSPQRGNLPLSRSSFVGRSEDMEVVELALGRSRLVTVVGPGGVGKTRLSIETASQVVDEFSDGCWLCELAPAGDDDAAIQIVAATLGAAPRPGRSLLQSIVDYTQSKDMLVLLDNCEHVLDTVSALADEVLRTCPNVRVLATSRQELGVEGEQVVRLGALGVVDVGAPFDVIEVSDAVRLFTDRAVAVRHDFVLDDTTARSVADICNRLDGMPLAIELAAARMGVMNPEQVAGLLDDRFRLLTTGRRSGDKRHQTLRATVDWSYSLLSPEEQEVFTALGVVVGTFDVDTVAAVVGGARDPWMVLDTLAGLVAKSMVVCYQQPDASLRYGLLETVHEYALDRLEETGEADAARRKLAAHMAEFADRAGVALLGPDELTWRPRLRAEMDAVRASVSWGLDSARDDDVELGVRIVAAFSAYAVFERAADLAALIERAVPAARRSTPGRRAAVLGSAAFAEFQVKGDVVSAEPLAREALSNGLTSDCPDPSSAYGTLIVVLGWTGRVDEALATIAEARAVLDVIGADDSAKAVIAQSATVVQTMIGDEEAARGSAAEALALDRRAGSPSGRSAGLWVSALATVRDDPEHALALVDEAISLIRAGASTAALGHLLAIRAQLLAQAADAASAIADLREAVLVSRDKGDTLMLVVCFDRGITVFDRLGRPDAVAFLAGAVTGESPLSVVSTLPQTERDDRASLIERARADLGPDAFDVAAARGASSSPEELIRFVLADLRTSE